MPIAAVSSGARAVLDDTGSGDATLAVLRSEGFTKVQSVRATVDVLGKPLDEAKALVHRSRAWADRQPQDEAFHAALDVAENPSAP